jgi:hypothetical protein
MPSSGICLQSNGSKINGLIWDIYFLGKLVCSVWLTKIWLSYCQTGRPVQTFHSEHNGRVH